MNKVARDLSTAYHEAGHAIIAWKFGIYLRRATIVPGDGFHGVVAGNFLTGIAKLDLGEIPPRVQRRKAANIPSVSRSPHAWRHSIGQKLTDDGVPLPIVARVLRHRSIQSTMHYTHAREKQAQAARELLNW